MRKNLLLSILVSSQLLLAFSLQVIIVRFFGAGAITDLYLISLIVPTVIQSVIGWAMTSFWLPRLSKISKKTDGWRIEFQIAHTQTLLVSGSFGLLFGVTAFIWFPLILPTHLTLHLDDGISFVHIVLLSQFFNALTEVFITAARSVGKFIKVESVLTIMLLIYVIASWFTIDKWGIEAVLWLGVIRALLVYLLLMITSNAPVGVYMKLIPKKYWVLLSYLLTGGSIYKTAPLVDRYWASQSHIGGLTLFSLAFSIMNAVSTIIQRSFSIPLIPKISKLIQQKKFTTFMSLYRGYMLRVAISCVLLLLIAILFKTMIIDYAGILLGLSKDELNMFWLIGACFMGYIFASSVGILTVNAYFAMNDTKTPTVVGVIGFCVSILVKGLSFIYFDLPGLALAISAYYLLNMIILDFLLKKTYENFATSSELNKHMTQRVC